MVAAACAPALGGFALQACTSSSNDAVSEGGGSPDAGGGSPEASCGAEYSFTPPKFKCCAPDSPVFCCGYDGVLDAAPALVEAGLLDDGGSVMRPACDSFCAPGFSGCAVSQAGPPFGFTCSTDCTGRRAGPSTEEASPRDLRDYFSRIAELEAESVVAFESIGRELRRSKAPASLRRAVSRARRDEIRHARIARALARRAGASNRHRHVVATEHASLEALAIDNAIEGCVRETFGSLVASYQAEHARDLGVRDAMRNIARDETSHAELAWSLAAWLESRLSPRGRTRARNAMLAALSDLERAVGAHEPRFHGMVGLPPRDVAEHFIEAMRARVSY